MSAPFQRSTMHAFPLRGSPTFVLFYTFGPFRIPHSSQLLFDAFRILSALRMIRVLRAFLDVRHVALCELR